MTKEELQNIEIHIKNMIINSDMSEFISFKNNKYIIDFRFFYEICNYEWVEMNK